MLKGVDMPQRLAELRAVREPLYAGIADITLTTDNRRVARVAELALRELGLTRMG
jgi:shikimate kinase